MGKHAQTDGDALVIAATAEDRSLIAQALRAEHLTPAIVHAEAGPRVAAAERPPRLVVVDAGADGPRWCREVRDSTGLEELPLIALVADAARDPVNDCYDAGATAVLIKPVTRAFLRERFRASLAAVQRPALVRQPANAAAESAELCLVLAADGTVREHLGGGKDDPLLPPRRLLGRRLSETLPDGAATKIVRNIRRALSERQSRDLEFELTGPDGKQTYRMRLVVQGRDRLMAVTRNVTGREPEARDRDEIFADTLTGLPKRAAFMANLDVLLSDAKLRERGLALMTIDIDRFSRINQTLGRRVGDAVLRVAGARIERCLRGADQLQRCTRGEPGDNDVSRFGSDEFMVVLRDIEHRADASRVADRVRAAFADPVSFEGHQLQISPSIGIAMFPHHGECAEQLLSSARSALDEARRCGEAREEFFSSTMTHRALKRLDMKNELKWALEKQQLELRYLPRFDMATGALTGLEALLRWQHPLRGQLALDEVLPLAQVTGLMPAIGEWVVNAACAQAACWRESWAALPPVSVNLSGQEFKEADLPRIVRSALDAAELPPPQLELEVTEAMLVRHDRAELVLESLRAIGVGLMIDDFGMGHTSLGRLIHYPIAGIKIDRSFVSGCAVEGPDRAVCAATIAVADELGLRAIAEGVESAEQFDFLRGRGCHELQGFLLSKPLRIDQVPAFLDGHLDAADGGGVFDLEALQARFATA